MTVGAVTIFDEVVLPTDELDGWLEHWASAYRPGAEARGMRLVGAWRGFTEDPDAATVVLQWELPGPDGFFAARGRASGDEGVAAFWASTDRVALRRSRRALGDAGLVP